MSIAIKDGASADKNLKTTEQSGAHLIHKIVEGIAKTGASYAPGADDDDVLPFAIDKTSGGLLCHNRRLAAATDIVTALGDLAHDAVDAETLVLKVGAKATNASSEPAVVAAGDRVAFSVDILGRQRVVIGGADNVTCYTSSARTASPTPMTVANNLYAKGCLLFIGVTALTDTPSVQFILEALTPLSGAPYVTIVDKTITAIGTYCLKVYPGITPVANEAVSDILPRGWRLRPVHADSDSITYNAVLQYIP